MTSHPNLTFMAFIYNCPSVALARPARPARAPCVSHPHEDRQEKARTMWGLPPSGGQSFSLLLISCPTFEQTKGPVVERQNSVVVLVVPNTGGPKHVVSQSELLQQAKKKTELENTRHTRSLRSRFKKEKVSSPSLQVFAPAFACSLVVFLF